MIRPLLALALLPLLAVAAPVPKAVKKKADKERIVGTWKSAGGGSEWFRFDADGEMRLWTTTSGSAETGVTYAWTVDPDADPKRMTWRDPFGRPRWEGVYELDGDRLRVVYTSAGLPLPRLEDGVMCDLIRVEPDGK